MKKEKEPRKRRRCNWNYTCFAWFFSIQIVSHRAIGMLMALKCTLLAKLDIHPHTRRDRCLCFHCDYELIITFFSHTHSNIHTHPRDISLFGSKRKLLSRNAKYDNTRWQFTLRIEPFKSMTLTLHWARDLFHDCCPAQLVPMFDNVLIRIAHLSCNRNHFREEKAHFTFGSKGKSSHFNGSQWAASVCFPKRSTQADRVIEFWKFATFYDDNQLSTAYIARSSWLWSDGCLATIDGRLAAINWANE